jgi:hypothetical protein
MNAFRILIFWASFLGLLASSPAIFAQNEEIRIKSEGSIIDSGSEKKLDGVQIIVFKNGAQDQVIDVGNTGKFDFKLPLGFSYDIKFSRADYVTKIIRIDTRNISTEDRAGGFLFPMASSLFQYVEGFNTDILKEPVIRASFDSQTNTVSWDNAYGEMMKKKIDDEFKRLADIAKNGDKLRKDYEKLMLEGDDRMAGTKFEEAMTKYKGALNLFPSDKPAKDKYDEAERKFREQQANKNNDARYAQLIKDGDAQFKSQAWEGAQAKYTEALSIKSNEPYPKAQLDEILRKLDALEQEKKYKALIAQADGEFSDENYATCISTYKEALKLKSDDVYPKKQIDLAQAALDAIANDKNKQEEIEKRYKALIASADDLFSKKQYQEAIDKYESASDVKPQETYPPVQIDKAKKALEAANTVVRNTTPIEDPQLKEYKKLIAEGDQLFEESALTDEQKMVSAKAKYVAALNIKIGERYPSKQIESIDAAILDLHNTDSQADTDWKEKRIKQEQEFEEIRRQKEKEAEENRLARIKENEDAEAKRLEEEDSKKRLRLRNRKSDVDADAEKAVDDFYRDAQKKAEKRKMLDIVQAKSQDSTAQAGYKEQHREQINDAKAEIDIKENQLIEISRSAAPYLTANESAIDSAKTDIDASKQNYTRRQRREIERASEFSNEGKTEITEFSKNDRERKKNEREINTTHSEQNTQTSEFTERSKRSRNKNSTRIEEQKEVPNEITAQGNEDLAAEIADIQQDKEHFAGVDNQIKTAGQSGIVTNTKEIERNKTTQEEINDKSPNLLEKQRMGVNENSHVLETKILDDKAKAEKTKNDNSKIRPEYPTGPKDPSLLNPKPGTETLAEGVTEKSYETSRPSQKVIERTVKIGAKVDVYQKVISKTGTYYFKNDISITEDQWTLDTTIRK